MNRARTNRPPRSGGALLALLGALALVGCGESSASVSVSGKRADGTRLSALDREAADFVRSKLESTWVKGSNGWTTELQQVNVFGQVMGGTPDVHFHQLRELELSIRPEPVTEAMKLNGTDYRGVAELERTPERTYRAVETWEGPQGWSDWKDSSPGFGGLAIERRNGQWLIQDDPLFAGIKPATVPGG